MLLFGELNILLSCLNMFYSYFVLDTTCDFLSPSDFFFFSIDAVWEFIGGAVFTFILLILFGKDVM